MTRTTAPATIHVPTLEEQLAFWKYRSRLFERRTRKHLDRIAVLERARADRERPRPQPGPHHIPAPTIAIEQDPAS